MGFHVEHVAIHLVDPQLDEAVLADSELLLDRKSFPKQTDLDVVTGFLQRHLEAVWTDDQARSAHLNGSLVSAHYSDFLTAEAAVQGTRRKPRPTFLRATSEMAKLLNDAQVGKPRSSRGLLLAVDFWPTDDEDRRHLALIKLDPGDRDLLTLRSRGQRVLLELAVQHVNLALPDPGAEVQKWAVIPHPDDRSVGAKLRDKQSRKEAEYFVDFLGAATEDRDAEVIDKLADAFGQYASEAHPDDNWEEVVPAVAARLSDELRSGEPVDVDEMVDAMIQASGLTNAQPAAIKQQLQNVGISTPTRVVRPADLGDHRVTYTLNNDITISGPASVMENERQFTIKKLSAGYRFTIKAAAYSHHRRD